MTEENDWRMPLDSSVLMLMCWWWYRRHASVVWSRRLMCLGELAWVNVHNLGSRCAGIRKPYALSSQLELQRKLVRRLDVSFYELFAP
jgi:hypothetical protein